MLTSSYNWQLLLYITHYNQRINAEHSCQYASFICCLLCYLNPYSILVWADCCDWIKMRSQCNINIRCNILYNIIHWFWDHGDIQILCKYTGGSYVNLENKLGLSCAQLSSAWAGCLLFTGQLALLLTQLDANTNHYT